MLLAVNKPRMNIKYYKRTNTMSFFPYSPTNLKPIRHKISVCFEFNIVSTDSFC